MIDTVHMPDGFVSRHCMLLTVAALFVCGCTGTIPIYEVRSDAARQTLIDTLTSWRDGQTPTDLQNRTPSTTVQDPDWAKAAVLKHFEIPDDGQPVGANLSVRVLLRLASTDNTLMEKEVWYLVGTDPALTVFRDTFH